MTALLRTEGVSKAFGGVQALAECTVEVEQGSIAGPDRPERLGQDHAVQRDQRLRAGGQRPGLPARRRHHERAAGQGVRPGIGRTFQLTRVFPRLTVMENMIVAAASPRPKAPGGAAPAAQPAGPGRRAGHPAARHGAAGVHRDRAARRRRAGTLSYGQRKLLELSYVLIANPAIVLLDEPAGGVNPTLIGIIADRIRELNREGTTFLIVEHNMEFVMGLCDRVTVIDYGTPVVTGPPEMIRTDHRVLDAYLGTEEGDDDLPA